MEGVENREKRVVGVAQNVSGVKSVVDTASNDEAKFFAKALKDPKLCMSLFLLRATFLVL